MNFTEYQAAADSTASYPSKGENLIYPALGLAGEAGEAVEKIKKVWRNRGVTAGKLLTPIEYAALIKEIGDVLWYVSAIASELSVPLEFVAQQNIAKLLDRKQRGVIKSEGDNR